MDKIIDCSYLKRYNRSMDNLNKADGFRSQRIIILPEDILNGLKEDPLASSAYISDIGYFPNAQYHYRERRNGCDAYILIYCGGGEGWYSINGGEKHRVKKGELIIIPPNVPHVYSSSKEKPWSIYWLHMNGANVQDCFKDIDVNSPVSLTIDMQAKFIELFEDVYSVFEKGCGGSSLVYASKVAEHLAGVVYFSANTDDSVRASKAERAIGAAISFMNKNITKAITIEDICEVTNFSAPHIISLFKKATGYSPINYFLRLKIQNCCKYLDLTDYSIKEIAYKFGFNDPYYFSRLFKKIMGTPPLDYRKREKG